MVGYSTYPPGWPAVGRRYGGNLSEGIRLSRKADGRRVFTTEFKRATVQRIVTGEKTVAELSRELDIAPSVIRNWKRFADAGATTAVQASEDVVPASQLREAYAKIRELERALGRKTMEVEILRAAQEIVKKTPSLRRESAR